MSNTGENESAWEMVDGKIIIDIGKLIYPQPTKPCRDRWGAFHPLTQQMKIKEELEEGYQEFAKTLNYVPYADVVDKIRERELEEYVDAMTAIMTYLRGRGFTEEEITSMIVKVNLKNKMRGYWEEQR